ncbi:MAG: BTAD domain-containing putative transcriptional regulator [Nocardioides sp.]
MAQPVAPQLLIAVLGATEVVRAVDGRRCAHPVTQIQARLLARLATQSSPVEIEDLVEAVWGVESPRTARASLANQVSRLRARYGDQLVSTTSSGYRLGVSTDVQVVADLVRFAGGRLAAGDAAAARDGADAALTWRRGAPFAALRNGLVPHSAARYADELLMAAETLRLSASLQGSWSAWSVAEAERLVVETPYDEQRWALLARALDDAGRRGDALAVLDRARRTLRDELGLDPGPLLTATDELLRRVGAPSSLRNGDLCLGREDALTELARLRDSSARIQVHGEEGGGVTTVLREVARRMRAGGDTVAFVACTNTPDQPLAELMTLLESLTHDPSTPVRSLADTFVASVGRLARSRPVTLVVDDLHLAGPSTLNALTRAATQPDVTLIASARRPLVAEARSGWARIELAPLDREAIAAVVGAHRGGESADVSPDICWYQQMSGGNPAFLTLLLESPAVPEVVGSLADVVRSRMGQLGAAARLAVEVAAVAGSGAPESVVAEFSSTEGVARAVATHVLQRRDRALWFRHGVVEYVLAREVAAGRRMELHQAVGERMLDLGHVVAAAGHLLAASDLSPDAALAATLGAAVESSRLGAHLDAAQWYDRGLEVARRYRPEAPEVALRLLVAHGNELRLAGDRRHVDVLVEAFEAAVEIGSADLVADAAVAVLALGTTTESGQPHDQVGRLLARSLEVVDDRPARARIRSAASLALSMVGEPGASRELFDEAERDADSPEVRRAVLPYAYLAIGTPDQLRRRDRLGRELLGLAEAARDPVAEFEAHHLLFSTALQHSDGAAVREHVRRLRLLVDRVGDIGRRWSALYASAALAHLEGDLSGAELLSEDAYATFAPVSGSRAFAAYGGQLLALRLAQGRLPELLESIEGLIRDQPGVPAWRAAASLAMVETDPAGAARSAELALHGAPQDFTWLASRLSAGRAAALIGHRSLATAYLAQLDPWTGLTCWQGTCSYGPVDTTLALLHRALGNARSMRHHAAIARELAHRLDASVFLHDLDALAL